MQFLMPNFWESINMRIYSIIFIIIGLVLDFLLCVGKGYRKVFI